MLSSSIGSSGNSGSSIGSSGSNSGFSSGFNSVSLFSVEPEFQLLLFPELLYVPPWLTPELPWLLLLGGLLITVLPLSLGFGVGVGFVV